jgi:hypothetical protein
MCRYRTSPHPCTLSRHGWRGCRGRCVVRHHRCRSVRARRRGGRAPPYAPPPHLAPSLLLTASEGCTKGEGRQEGPTRLTGEGTRGGGGASERGRRQREWPADLSTGEGGRGMGSGGWEGGGMEGRGGGYIGRVSVGSRLLD